jgi:hypothetical protein
VSRRDLWVGVWLCLHSPIHTAPSRALASVVPSLERTGGLCARAGGGGVRPGPEVFPTTLVRPEEALGGGRNGVGAQDPGEPGCFVSIGGRPVGSWLCRAEEERGERTIFDFMPPKNKPPARATRSGGPPGSAALSNCSCDSGFVPCSALLMDPWGKKFLPSKKSFRRGGKLERDKGIEDRVSSKI